MTTVDDDVRVWVAARTLSRTKPEFTLPELLAQLTTTFKAADPRLEKFITQRCVANLAGPGGEAFNYLFRVAPGKFRMFRAGDPVEVSHASAPAMPNVSKVPEQYRGLYSNRERFPSELRPAEVATIQAAPKEKAKRSTAAPPPTVPAGPGLLVGLEAEEQGPVASARKTIFDLLFLEFGKVGTRMESTRDDVFTVAAPPLSGTAHTVRNVMVRMPNGHLVAHRGDIVIELEHPTRTLVLDIVEGTQRSEELKARSFDAIHLRAEKEKKNRDIILVYVRTPHGLLQEQAEAIAHGYNFFFGVDAEDVKLSSKFSALKSHIVAWAEGRVKTAARVG